MKNLMMKLKAENKKLRDDLDKTERKLDRVDTLRWIFFGIAFVVLSVLVIGYWMHLHGDDSDTIDTKAMGYIMCKEYGLEYDYRDIQKVECPYEHPITRDCWAKVPKIHCKEPETEEQKLVDDIVLGPKKTKQRTIFIK